MTSRVPPSNKPPTRTGNEPAFQPRTRRSSRPQGVEKPKLIKAGGVASSEDLASSPEAMAWAGQDIDHSLEIRAADVEARMAELAHQDEAAQEQHAEQAAEHHEHAEKHDKHSVSGLFKLFNWQKNAKPETKAPQTPQQQAKQTGQGQGTNKHQALKPQGTVSSTQPKLQPSLTSASVARLQQVAKLSGESASNERPPDAFALLKEARDKGVLFVEDALAEGHSEEQEDPELAAAVEECIRICFGARGILRIGPGKNDRAEPIIVVVTTHGFSEASLAQVPQKVHRFPTLMAIPFELLPLRRDR